MKELVNRWFSACVLLIAIASPGDILVAENPPESAFGFQIGHAVEEHVRSSKLAILPLGSVEYHGPSGPPLTDSIIAEGIAGELADQLSASLLPVLHYTHSPSHTDVFAGTVSVRPEVVTLLLEDVLRSLFTKGFDKVLILNGHDGNIGPARGAISRATRQIKGSQAILVSWWETLPAPEVEALNLFASGNGGHGHGGPLELSVAAVYAPRSVEAGKGPDLPALEFDIGFPFYLEKSDVTGWPGYSGKLSEIDALKGRKLADIAVSKISGLVKHWLENDDKPGSW